jgi:hypothetical protein
MATTLGGVTLADPLSPTERSQVFVGQHRLAHDGTVLTDFAAIKWRWPLRWDNLTQAQRDTIYTQVQVTTSQTFSPPNEAGSYTVVVMQDTYREIAKYMDVTRYEVEFEVEELS